MKRLILASGSPRRKEMLEQVGIPFTVQKSDVDESVLKETKPADLVEGLAQLKGESIEIKGEEVILSADTVVGLDDKILTKPTSRQEAIDMLNSLNGREHLVYTGVMIRSVEKQVIFSTCTSVEFWNLSEQDIKEYIETGDPFDKAGGYGIQSKGAMLVKRIAGDYFTIVGLPIAIVVQKLKTFDIYPFKN